MSDSHAMQDSAMWDAQKRLAAEVTPPANGKSRRKKNSGEHASVAAPAPHGAQIPPAEEEEAGESDDDDEVHLVTDPSGAVDDPAAVSLEAAFNAAVAQPLLGPIINGAPLPAAPVPTAEHAARGAFGPEPLAAECTSAVAVGNGATAPPAPPPPAPAGDAVQGMGAAAEPTAQSGTAHLEVPAAAAQPVPAATGYVPARPAAPVAVDVPTLAPEDADGQDSVEAIAIALGEASAERDAALARLRELEEANTRLRVQAWTAAPAPGPPPTVGQDEMDLTARLAAIALRRAAVEAARAGVKDIAPTVATDVARGLRRDAEVMGVPTFADDDPDYVEAKTASKVVEESSDK